MLITPRVSTVVLALLTLGVPLTNLHAQQQIDCGVPPERDLDGNGLDDELVSPTANISDDVLITCESRVGENAGVLYGSQVIQSQVEANARVSRSTLRDDVLVKSGAKVQSSGANRFSVIESGAYVQDSFLDFQVTVGENATVYFATVSESDIGSGAKVLNGATVIKSRLGPRVVVFKRANLQGNNFGFGGIVIGADSLIGEDTQLLGPLEILEHARIGNRVEIDGSQFIGSNFRIGNDSRVRDGGDILGDVTIGSRVEVGVNQDIENNVRIDSDVYLGPGGGVGEDSTIRSNVYIDYDTFVGRRVAIGLQVSIGNRTTVGDDVIVRNGATIGSDVIIGEGAIIDYGANVPDGTVVAAGELYR